MATDSLKTFRRKMANPLNWRKANQILLKYSKEQMSTRGGSRAFIEELSKVLSVELSEAEVVEAAKWMQSQQMDPRSKRDRMGIWKKIK